MRDKSLPAIEEMDGANLDELRQRAEAWLRRFQEAVSSSREKDFENMEQLLHELNVYHIELEMQNEELRRTQQKQEDSLVYMTALFRHAPVGFVTLRPEGVIIDASLLAYEYFDVGVHSLIGLNLLTQILPVYKRKLEKIIAASLEDNDPKSCDVRYYFQGRKERWLRLRISPLRQHQGHGPIILCVLQEITNMKFAEQNQNVFRSMLENTNYELRDRQERLEKQIEEMEAEQGELRARHARCEYLFNSTPSGIFTLGPDDSILEINHRGAMMLGLTPRELKGLPFTRYIEPNDLKTYAFFKTRIFETRSMRTEHIMLTNHEGEAALFRLDGLNAPDDTVGSGRIIINCLPAVEAPVREA